jgi:preprotein translocase subunit SecF
MSQTMSRTILTGGATLLTLLVLLIFGGEVLRSFAFTMFFGIIIGTYSSIFVASSFVYEYANKFSKKVEF